MFFSESRTIVRFQGLAQIAIAQLVLALLASVWFGFWRDMQLVPRSLGIFAFILLVGLHLGQQRRSANSLHANLVTVHMFVSRQVVFVLFLLTVTYALVPLHSVSILFLIVFGVLLYAVFMITYRPIKNVIGRLVVKKIQDQTLVVGPPETNEKMRKLIQASIRFDFLVDCYESSLLCEERANGDSQDVFFSDLTEIIKRKAYGQIVLSRIPKCSVISSRMVQFCNQNSVRLFIVSDLHEKFGHSLHLLSSNGLQLICLREEPLSDPFNRILKRAFDIGVASCALLVLLPISVVVAIAQRVQSPGPLLFVQRRAGLRNHEFDIWKFRSMHVINDFPSEQASRRDKRVFPFGRFMRRFSIDEFPQFINVLKGEMSVVGPRPHMLEHNREFQRYLSSYNVRTFVKPGITGLAQVRGYRGETRAFGQIEKRVQSDVFYLENWTFSLDVLIVLRTVAQLMVPSRNAF